MKEHILISTIVRNREFCLNNYFNQIIDFVDSLSPKFDFSISIYENDSIDKSKEILCGFDFSIFKTKSLIIEDIGTKYFGSIPDKERVINLAVARNKTIDNLDLNKYNWILTIEPDIIYDFDIINRIISRCDLNFQPDIYSGMLLMNGIPYDIWGTRRNDQEEWGGYFNDYEKNPIKEFWSTGNGICLYNINPFISGIRFSAFNKRLNKYDCEAAVLCEDFREMGYNKIYINQSINPVHNR